MRSVGHPTVSIVIPTYNRAALIARSIQSVLNQSYADFELLVIDDGSTDETEGVVAGFFDLRINYVRLASNAGVGAARNVGIRISKGKFIAFQDSDDEWLSDNLAKHMSVFERSSPNLGVVYSDMHRMLKDGSVRYHASPTVVPGRLINPTTQFYEVYMLGSQSVVIKRDCLDATGYFNEELPALEDLELFIRLSKRFDFFRIPEPLVRYYETDGLSKNRHATLHARKLLVKWYYKELLLHAPSFLFQEWLWVHKTKLRFMVEAFVRTDKSRQPIISRKSERNHAQLQPERFRLNRRKHIAAKRLMSRGLHSGTSDNPSRIDGPHISPVPETAERPFWSVMIPTYNPNLNYLAQSLGSVLEQAPAAEHMQIELIDDGSTNFDPQSFLRNLAGSKVSFYRQPQHRGIGGNWNTCLERARGHWVHLLHQDDLVLSGFYRRLYDGIEKEPSVGAAFCHNIVIDSEGRRAFYPSRIKQTTPGVLTDWLEYVFVRLSITTPSIVVKRDVYEQLGGFDVSFNYALDWDMWKRIASRRLLWYEPDPLAVTRQHKQSTTRKLMQSGTNIAEIRRSIETSKSYLAAVEAADMASRAQNYYTSYAVTRAAQLLLVARDRRAFLAHLREARKIRSSTAVMKAFIKLSLKTLGERLRRRLP